MFSETQPWGTGDPQPWITATFGPGYKPSPKEFKFQSTEWGPINLMHRIVAQRLDPFTGKTVLKSLPMDDAVLPVSLNFPVPLRDVASNSRAFEYHWEKLTYAFNLPSPAQFPVVELSPSDREIVVQYVKNCRTLAEYSIFNDSHGDLSITTRGDETTVTANLPSSEAFTGASARFRHLHNDMENASFIKVKNVLSAALKDVGSSKRTNGRTVIKTWAKARASLDEKMIQTIIAERLVKERPVMPTPTFKGVKPAELIKTYNYGDTLHWGAEREKFAKLNNDKDLDKFWMHCVVSSMITLGHFYFGFSVAAMSALGNPPIRSLR